MKKLYLLVLVANISALAACKKTTESAGNVVNIPFDSVTVVAKFEGVFGNGPYGAVNGVATVYDDKNVYRLALEDFSTSNGPDLHVYLSKEVEPIHFIDLGKLQSTSGKQVYNISGRPDFSEYKYALVHCQLFNHLFGSAALKIK
jgi:hypothetical protein